MAVSDPMRIWQICESYPPKYGGGAGIIAKDISEVLADRGHDVRVLCTESRAAPDYSSRTEQVGGVTIEWINLPYFVDRDPDGWQLGMLKWMRHERRIARWIDEKLASWRPDIAQYHTTRPLGEVGPEVIARHRVPVIGMFHESWFICPRLVLFRSPTARPCTGPGAVKCLECMYSHYDRSHLRAAAKLSWRIPRLGIYPAYRVRRRKSARNALTGSIAYSRFVVNMHRPHLCEAPNYIPIGISLAGVPTARPSRPHTPFRFGFFGGFQPHKGIWDVLDAASVLRREGLEFELHVWGPPGASDEDAVASRGLQGMVRVNGLYKPEEMWSAYCTVDAAVMATTVCEGFGRIPLEARAVGAPTIAPAIGGLTESIRDGVDGLLYRFRDRRHLEQQMRRLLTEPGLFERLVNGLRPVMDTRSRAAAIEATYRSVIAAEAEKRSGA